MQGDSGGSLNCDDGNGSYYVVGITSWGVNINVSGVVMCDVDFPSVFTRTSSYLEWIAERISDFGETVFAKSLPAH